MAKNFDNIGCLFCGELNIIQHSNCVNCGQPLDISSMFISDKVNGYAISDFVGRGFYGLTYKCTDMSGKNFAIKLLSKNAYAAQGKDFLNEIRIYASIPNSNYIAQYIGTGEYNKEVGAVRLDIFYIVSEWIDGVSLKKYIVEHTVSPDFLNYFFNDILYGLLAFEEAGLWHRDLHEENILVATLSHSQKKSLQREDPIAFKIVDIGSAKARTASNIKDISDIQYVGRHATFILKQVECNYTQLLREDRLFLKLMLPFAAKLSDENVSRSYTDIASAIDDYEKQRKHSRFTNPTESEILEEPLGLINALDIVSPKMLKQLFSTQFRYFDDIQSRDYSSIVITGPRGCGKTMLLRNMSFDVQFECSNTNNNFHDLKFIGIFMSSRFDIGNLLVSDRRPNWIMDNRKIGFYFNGLIVCKLIDIFYTLVENGVINEHDLQDIIFGIAENYGIKFANLYNLKSHITSILSLIQNDSQNVDTFITESNSTPTFLNYIVEQTRGRVSAFKNKEFILLIDDLSLPKIPKEILQSLNPFIYNPGARYKIRVSAHSDGLILHDRTGEDFKENRDYIQINLGNEYYILSEDFNKCLQGFNDILAKRFKLANKGSFLGLEKILGNVPAYKNFGAVIKNYAKSNKLGRIRYKGVEIFIKLCSGDLSYSIDLLRKMINFTDESGVVNVQSQHKVIKSYARLQLSLLRDIRSEHIPSLYDVGLAFGEMSREKLIKNGSEHLRIEIDFASCDIQQKEAIRELLTYGLFIDGGFSANANGKITRKLLFRRIFTPVFPTTVNNSDTFNFSPERFSLFINNPSKCRDLFLNLPEPKQTKRKIKTSKSLLEYLNE